MGVWQAGEYDATVTRANAENSTCAMPPPPIAPGTFVVDVPDTRNASTFRITLRASNGDTCVLSASVSDDNAASIDDGQSCSTTFAPPGGRTSFGSDFGGYYGPGSFDGYDITLRWAFDQQGLSTGTGCVVEDDWAARPSH